MAKVCHLITRLILGGAQRLALETAAHLRHEGWDVQLWTGPQTGPEGSLHAAARAHGLPVRIIQDLVREVSPLRDLHALQELRRRFTREPFDIVHTHSSKAGILGRLAASYARIPVRIHSVHGWSMTPASRAPARFIYTHLERIVARRTHTLVAVSEAVRDAGLAAGIGRREQYEVIHGGILPPTSSDADARVNARRKLGVAQDCVVIGTVGRLDDAKDPLGALHGAIPLLRAQPNLRLVFIGDGQLRSRLEYAIECSGCGGQVVMAGLHSDASALLAAFDLFFLSSRWEGFPLVVIEAMAARLPVVAYNVAGIREAVEDGRTGFLTQPGQESQWRKHIRQLVEDPQLRQRMGQAGRSRALSRFGMDRMLAETGRLYQRLLASRGI
ncbi:MAG: glycosyltransferase family 4 protein [Candidatus Eisenbacteria sp.]|nr:glycosyltransferase family 4 protein [Candidatus Eisenbacteria bacterium]